jgi:hypothetical protein
VLERVGRRLPAGVKRRIRRSGFYVRHRSAAQNVYFLCVQRTASRWLRRVFRDNRVYRASGLEQLDWFRTLPDSEIRKSLTEITFPDRFPLWTLVGPLYTAHAGYESILKPPEYRAFFVMRDPRDIVVSWYHAMTYSHPSMGGMLDPLRQQLGGLSKEEGLRLSIRLLNGPAQLFPALRSWADARGEDERLLLVRYEDLTGTRAQEAFRKLFVHCDIRTPNSTLTALLEDYSFQRLTGRRPGEEDVNAHLRKGTPGDWRQHLGPYLLRDFRDATGDLVEVLGYEGY